MSRKILVVLVGALVYAVALLLAIATIPPARAVEAQNLSPIEQLGKELFFDANLSDPIGQSCASCHAQEVGWTGPDETINMAGGVYEGAVAGRFGNRKPPAAAYAGDSPILHKTSGMWVGGMFWDGRATGNTLGDPLAEQAQGPFLNPLEQNMASPQAVCEKVKESDYATLFEQVWGSGSLDCGAAKVALTYERIARSIAAYERSAEVSSFTSKYDYYLKGEATLTAQEESGRLLFIGKGNCASCHVSEPGPNGAPPLFTDFTYDNIGVPKNPDNPFYAEPEWNPDGAKWVDVGLGGFLKSAGYSPSVYEREWGKFKVPTLRNVDKRPNEGFVKAYGHNGYFKSLEDIVHFYNTRDVPQAGWPAPEVRKNLNKTELGKLGLTPAEEAAIVAFLRTLSDGYTPAGN